MLSDKGECMKLPKSVIVLGLIVAAVVIGWNLLFPSGTWRYKVIVSIETPEGIKTGSAVREMHVVDTPNILPEVHASIDVKGEAVVVDLGKRGVVYAVMGTDDYYTVFNAFPVEGATTAGGIRYYKSLKPGTSASLALQDRPMLVTFKDPSDPKTVTLAYHAGMEHYEIPSEGGGTAGEDRPKVFEDNMEALFGKGVKLKGITVEMTDEKVTRGIAGKYLPKFNEDYWNWVSGLDYSSPVRLGPNNFY